MTYNSQLNQLQNHMSSPPRVYFNKPTANANSQLYSIYNPALPNNTYHNYENRATNLISTVTAPPEFYQKPQTNQTVVVERTSAVQQIPRPQYEKSKITNAPIKRLAPERDPAPNSTCCSPCWWVIGAVIGLAGLTLALLYGLNVIGGTDTQKVSAAAVSPTVSSAAPTSTSINPTPTSTSSTTTTSSTTPTNSLSTTGVTGSPSSTSTTTQPTADSVVPAFIPAIPVSTSSHQSAGKILFDLGDSLPRVVSNEQQRHRLSVDE